MIGILHTHRNNKRGLRINLLGHDEIGQRRETFIRVNLIVNAHDWRRISRALKRCKSLPPADLIDLQRLSALASVDAAARLEFLHRLFQLTATIAILERTKMNPRISLSDLVARLETADHTIAYFNTPLPEPLLDGLRLLAGRRGRGSLDLVEQQKVSNLYL